MSLRIIKTEHSDEWDNIVQSFKKYDVYYLSGYVKAFQLHGDGEPLLFYFENDSTRAINVVMKRDIADSAKFKDKIPQKMYFDFSTPYGYGGFLVEGEDFKQIELEYTQYCKKIILSVSLYHTLIETLQMKCYEDSLYLAKRILNLPVHQDVEI